RLGTAPRLGLGERRCPPLGRGALRRLPLLLHEAGPEHALRFKLVVGATPDANARHRRLAAAGECLDVIEFEELARLTTMPGLARERALAAIALPDRPLDRRGDVPRARRLARLACAGASGGGGRKSVV